MSIISRTSIAIAFTLAATVAAAPAQAATVRGVVVHHNHGAKSFTVAGARGALRAVHARRAPHIGRRVAVRVRRLRNGTFAARHVRVGARHSHVRIRGTVTQVDRSARSFVVSARGVSLVVHRRHGRRARSADAGPGVGEQVDVQATVDPSGEIDAEQIDSHGTNHGTIELEGVVLAVDAAGATLTLSGDDDGGSGSITVLLPPGFDTSVYAVGDEIELRAILNADGTYTAVGTSGDHGVHQADGAGDDQGENEDGHRGHGDPTVAQATAQCQSEQSDPNFAASHEGKAFAQYYTPEDDMSSFQKCVDENSHGQGSGSGDSGSGDSGSGD